MRASGATTAAQNQAALRLAFVRHRDHLWQLCYRMTGCAADADDLVQETFRRALEAPPEDVERDLRPWLVRVAVNASRDALRARKRRGYIGTWLPSPIETANLQPLESRQHDGEARYGERESVTFAFLIALEELSATQRAVLLLRDVLDYSVRETAEALQITEASCKTTLHRARAALARYDARAVPANAQRLEQTREVLRAFCVHLAARNVPALEALLAADVRARNDGGGEFFAARRPVLGRSKVITFHLNVMRYAPARFALLELNGWPALVADVASPNPKIAARSVLRIELDRAGKICEIDTVVATHKLSAIDFERLPAPDPLTFTRGLRAALLHPPLALWAAPALSKLARAAVATKLRPRAKQVAQRSPSGRG